MLIEWKEVIATSLSLLSSFVVLRRMDAMTERIFAESEIERNKENKSWFIILETGIF
jgi:hypothetical protein